MADLPFELILFGILTLLPPKFIGRCRTVCKAWNWALTAETFVNTHWALSATRADQFVYVIDDHINVCYPIEYHEYHEYGPERPINIPFDHHSYDHRSNDLDILSCLNGLLFVRHTLTSQLYLWNPLTNAFKHFIAPTQSGVHDRMIDKIGLYTDVHGDFKVLYLSRLDHAVEAYVHSRSDDSWRNIPLPLPTEYVARRLGYSNGTLCSGFLYFVVSDGQAWGLKFLLTFNVNSEEFGIIYLPEGLDNGLNEEFGGILYVHLVDQAGDLFMFTATGLNESSRNLWIQMWRRTPNTWERFRRFPPIHVDVWCSISHYVSTGDKWFVMAKEQVIWYVQTPWPSLGRFYSVTNWTTNNGALITESLLSPSIEHM